MQRTIQNGPYAMACLPTNIEKIKSIPTGLKNYLLTCEKPQDVVDALHSSLSNSYNSELDWLYSTFFTRTAVLERRGF